VKNPPRPGRIVIFPATPGPHEVDSSSEQSRDDVCFLALPLETKPRTGGSVHCPAIFSPLAVHGAVATLSGNG
jgi:hypothetical protein